MDLSPIKSVRINLGVDCSSINSDIEVMMIVMIMIDDDGRARRSDELDRKKGTR